MFSSDLFKRYEIKHKLAYTCKNYVALFKEINKYLIIIYGPILCPTKTKNIHFGKSNSFGRIFKMNAKMIGDKFKINQFLKTNCKLRMSNSHIRLLKLNEPFNASNWIPKWLKQYPCTSTVTTKVYAFL